MANPTRTAIIENPEILEIRPTAGEFLHFILEATLVGPIFAFVSNVAGKILEAEDFPDHPKSRYEWDHLRTLSDVQQLELLTVGMQFFTDADTAAGEDNPPDYSLTVERRFKDNSPSKTVMQVHYESDLNTLAHVSESFRLVIRG